MAQWTLTIVGKGVRANTVSKLAEKMKDHFGDGARVSIRDATPPSTRPERFAEAIDKIVSARSEMESLRDELQEWRDGLPENLQSGSKSDELDEAISALEDIIGELENQESAEVTFPGVFG